MKLRQVQYVCAVAENGLSVSAAADALFTSQPGISRQIRMLEEELGAPIFERSGRQFTRLTEFGRGILPILERIRSETENARRVASDLNAPGSGSLSIATTHTQARYVLPPIITDFLRQYPDVRFNLHQGTPQHIAGLVVSGKVDFAIATENLEHFADLVLLPCYQWNRAVMVPHGHSLENVEKPDLAMLARYPLISYTFGFSNNSRMSAIFTSQGLQPNLVLTATDSDVIKTYVRCGLGVGLLAKMAYEPERDADLACLDVRHLFPHEVTSIGVRRGLVLRGYMYNFIHRFAPHLNRAVVDAMLAAEDPREEKRLFQAQMPYLMLR